MHKKGRINVFKGIKITTNVFNGFIEKIFLPRKWIGLNNIGKNIIRN
jgi:hypothetical protein